MIETVVASQHDSDVDVGLVLEGERVVDRRMRDLVSAFRQPVAQLIGIRSELDFDIKAAPDVKALRLRREDRQVLHSRKYDDRKLAVVRTSLLWRSRKNERRRGGEQVLQHVVLPESLLFIL